MDLLWYLKLIYVVVDFRYEKFALRNYLEEIQEQIQPLFKIIIGVKWRMVVI